MRIVTLKPRSAYDVMRYFADGLDAAFRAAGHEVLVVDRAGEDRLAQLGAALATDPDIAFGFNATAPDPQFFHEGRNPFDEAGVPLFTALVDDPLYHWGQLAPGYTTIGKLAVSCMDREHVGAVSRDLGLPHTAHYLPHGGSEAQPGVEPEFADAHRPIDVLFPATWISSQLDEAEMLKAPEPARSLFAAARDRLTDEGITARGLAREVFPEHGVPVTPSLLLGAHALLTELDRYLRSNRRLLVLRSLGAAGLRVLVVGNHWEQAPPMEGIRFRRAYGYGDVLSLMQASKTVLHVGGTLWAAFHERPLSAMANGAVSITELNPEFEAAFHVGHELVGYQTSKVDELGEQVASLLADPRRRSAIAADGRARVLGAHLWAHRAQTLLELFDGRPAS